MEYFRLNSDFSISPCTQEEWIKNFLDGNHKIKSKTFPDIKIKLNFTGYSSNIFTIYIEKLDKNDRMILCKTIGSEPIYEDALGIYELNLKKIKESLYVFEDFNSIY